jgi:small-conductance mechanosensitive channel
MHEMWNELAGGLTTPVVYWQVAVIIFSMGIAWLLNGSIYTRITQQANESWKAGVGGVKRVLFPLVALGPMYIGKLILRNWQHTSLLALALTLLMAMALIRLVVYALRYIFLPSAWLKAAESSIAGSIWIVAALYLAGVLSDVVGALEGIGFDLGKHHISPLLILQAAVIVVVTVVAALSLSRFFENKLMQAEQINMNLRVVMAKLIRVFLTLAGVLTALSAVGFDITLLSVFGGALGVGLGFGLQKIASNYVSGFIILLDESVHLDDVITISGHYGVVKQIRSRYLVLRKLDGTEVVIPNETLISEAVINHSFTDRKARVNLPVQISYESCLERAMELMRDVAIHHPRVLQDPLPEVQVTGFGENGIDLQLMLWIPDPEEGSGGLKSALYLEIWRAFQQHAITVPYPQRDIRIIGSEIK